ncbi:GspH/FimT family pseudopilin [Candidatus Manganitrophus noduliformans]|uniref:Type II secretion system protein H n=1 Tax=Candidatus Manganitrophus noduliformans TaxID=2606439 RepID=A0A7X6DT74_9BACT|nr:GspH/FimT family protein [Candidatus Manganitrophus noduliformans]NKE72724.1 prepilin-type N-terminal cleavage/methylation domain-containing protein [Candidatus Manganitrophus noduliformans]
MHQRGFTLVEVVIVLVLLGILAVVAIPRLGNMAGTRASATARKLQSDIAYAQSLAMTRNLPHRVYFNTAPAPANGYAVVNDANGNGNWGVDPGEYAIDPANPGANLSVTLNAGSYAGVTISGGSFAGTFVHFNTLGVPTAGGTVIVSGGGVPITVAVQPETGSVSIP